MQDGGLENTWLIDFGCSRHVTGGSKWFSSLDPMQCKEYITFDLGIRFQFLRDHYEKGDIDLHHIDTQNQLAGIFTKPLDQAQFARLRGELGVCFPF
jgi:hypothetical protein